MHTLTLRLTDSGRCVAKKGRLELRVAAGKVSSASLRLRVKRAETKRLVPYPQLFEPRPGRLSVATCAYAHVPVSSSSPAVAD